ncbi:hypothetical protein H6P81_004724 [Aristolochia fimbriata]|uniref:VOC domain-containing protein n=1 Tax=Aristolochia fimbriata TaxID=158543 RepID=A0AAV7ESH1_ARIFI|nr:hypothetical protein H6P81_004724 [Aristolochia fimbriata]
MASAFSSSSLIIPQHLNEVSKGRISFLSTGVSFTGSCRTIATKEKDRRFALVAQVKTSAEGDLLVKESSSVDDKNGIGIVGVHHVGLLCKNLEKSLEFYQNLLGLEINEARPHNKLPYKGAWLWVGSEMIHLMELPNPDPLTGRPEHGGRDRHTCLGIRDVTKLKDIFDKAGIIYTLSQSGRPAIFTRDPDGNALEFTQI